MKLSSSRPGQIINYKALKIRDELLFTITTSEVQANDEEKIAALTAFKGLRNGASDFTSVTSLWFVHIHRVTLYLQIFESLQRHFSKPLTISSLSSTSRKKNILNFDQVPRYFDRSTSRTITGRGSKSAKLRKFASSHKRFTFTPIISLAGKVFAIHLLFSKLLRIPKKHQQKMSGIKTVCFASPLDSPQLVRWPRKIPETQCSAIQPNERLIPLDFSKFIYQISINLY